MRLRSRSARQKAYIWGFVGLAGAVILFAALPAWVFLAFIGASLMCGAYFGYKSGF